MNHDLIDGILSSLGIEHGHYLHNNYYDIIMLHTCMLFGVMIAPLVHYCSVMISPFVHYCDFMIALLGA